jgi:hypothetical protein
MMRGKTGPDRTRRSLLKAAAIIAGAVAAGGRQAAAQMQEGRYFYGDVPPPWPENNPGRVGGIGGIGGPGGPGGIGGIGGPGGIGGIGGPGGIGGIGGPGGPGGGGGGGGGGRPPWWRPPWWPGGGGGGSNVCFLRGTRIRTEDGYREIETLVAGDRVAAGFAGVAPIQAIDSFTLNRLAGAWLGPSRPVRVKRGALGDNVPAEDLCLTTSHALFVDGYLVPAGDLVNGTSIVFEIAEGQETLDFFHIELAHHDVLDAAGAPCESLRHGSAEPCVPLLGFQGGRSELRSRLRSAASVIVDRRQPIDVIRDTLEERAWRARRKGDGAEPTMRDRTGPARTRRSLLKATAIVAGAVAGHWRSAGAQMLEGRYYYGDRAPPPWIGDGPPPDASDPDNRPWFIGPDCYPHTRFLRGRRGPNEDGQWFVENCGPRPCFLRGTPILTDGSYRPVEVLAAGDRVAARFAGLAAIERMDSFTLLRSELWRDWRGPSRPVRVKRGALGDNVPGEDLCLTASHALFVDSYLVPAGDLVNGTSIVLDTAEGQDALDFFHIELAHHDVLDAAGAPCESLRLPGVEPCVPLLGFHGGRSELRSRLRSAASAIVDRRQPIDIIRDTLEERGRELARAA